MGFFSNVLRLTRRRSTAELNSLRKRDSLYHRCKFEEMEERRVMAADIHLGAVYYDPGSGEDTSPNVFHIQFTGGADGTQLTHLQINTDKKLDSLNTGDPFFHTSNNEPGVYGYHPFQVVSSDGVQVTNVQVVNGGTTLDLTFSGFTAGKTFVFSIDVDEIGLAPPASAVVEGAEFAGSVLTATFHADHYYDLTGNDKFVDAFDPKFTGSGLSLPHDNYSPPNPAASSVLSAGALYAGQQLALPSSLNGFVFNDLNLDNKQEGGEPGIGNVSLALQVWDTAQGKYVATGLTTTTDANGAYHFKDLQPGKYRVVETQPNGYFSIGATAGTVNGVTRGSVLTTDIITDAVLLGGEDSIHNDFAEALPGKISGFVYYDPNNNCLRDSGEPGIAGTVVNLFNAQSQLVATTTTDANGHYQFTGLRPGTYSVGEQQPAGYLDGQDCVGTAGGVVAPPDGITDIVLLSGTDGVEYNFGELLPASISGMVHVDMNGDCVFQQGEPLLAGVTMQLWDVNGQVIATTTTDAHGEYKFDNLDPFKTYSVHEVQPVGYFEFGSSVGTVGGTPIGLDTIGSIPLGSGTHGLEYNFCVQAPASISGMVHVDSNGDCVYQPGEQLLSGVKIELWDASNKVVATTTTDSEGMYSFNGLRPGTYTVHEQSPAGYFDLGSSVGTAGGTLVGLNTIAGANLGSGVVAVDYDFCVEAPASIAGMVHVDTNGDCIYQPGEKLLAGVTIQLIDVNNQVVATTTTDANGEYKFSGLKPGSYTVHELSPAGYFDFGSMVGTAGGTQLGLTTIVGAHLGSGTDALDYNFCVQAPATIAGMVHVDANGDCVYEPGEQLLAGVTIQLFDANNQLVATTTTDGNGEYKFTGLRPGTYTVHELSPSGYFDLGSSVGTAGGTLLGLNTIVGATLGSGVDATDYNFCVEAPSSIAGMVHVDANGDCIYQPGEKLLAGVTIQLFDANNQLVATTVTDDEGMYSFTGLRPGTYTVYEVSPAGYFDFGSSVGTVGGTLVGMNTITNIVLPSGISATDYDFCVQPPPSISGMVHLDTNGDCIWQPGEILLSGVTLQLFNANGELVAETTTDENGMYSFTNLSPGMYRVHEVQPSGLIDFGLNVGSVGGSIIDINTIDEINLTAGTTATDYNFCEEVLPFVPESVFTPPSLLPMAMPPELKVIVPVVWQDAVRTPFMLDYGGGYALGYTWHLSVIDAGEPRGLQSPQQRVALISMRSDPFQVPETDVHNSEWILGQDDSTEAHQRFVRFGMRNGIPVTGDFNGDGITDVGFFYGGQWFIDLNSNGQWDEGDLWAKLGHEGDKPVTGDWDGDGKTDIGIFGRAWPGDPAAIRHEPGLPAPFNTKTGPTKNVPPRSDEAALGYRTLKHTSKGDYRADVIDHVFHYGTPGDIPVTGDWHGTGVHTIGLFYKGRWILDRDGNGKWTETDHDFQYGEDGDYPVVGDFNGDGIDELGVYRGGTWYVDTNNDRVLDAHDKLFEVGGAGDVPVVGDWNGDGIDEPGVYHEGSNAVARAVPSGGAAPAVEVPTITE